MGKGVQRQGKCRKCGEVWGWVGGHMGLHFKWPLT